MVSLQLGFALRALLSVKLTLVLWEWRDLGDTIVLCFVLGAMSFG